MGAGLLVAPPTIPSGSEDTKDVEQVLSSEARGCRFVALVQHHELALVESEDMMLEELDALATGSSISMRDGNLLDTSLLNLFQKGTKRFADSVEPGADIGQYSQSLHLMLRVSTTRIRRSSRFLIVECLFLDAPLPSRRRRQLPAEMGEERLHCGYTARREVR